MNDRPRAPALSTLETWLQARGAAYERLEPLAGDVSARGYVRVVVADGPSRVAALYPAGSREAGERFLRSASLLAASGVRVPRVLAWDAGAGIMLLEDAGRTSVYDAVAGGEPRDGHLRRAVAILARLATIDAAEVAALNPPLDGAILRRELEQSRDLVLVPRGLLGSRGELEAPLLELCEKLAAAPRRPCHRDFMARNLLLDSRRRMTVIDHQDLRLGPPWYDLASLLNDSLYATGDEERRLLALARVPEREHESYHRAAAQRALKIVGTFTAFAQRGHDRHLPLVAPSLRAARRHLAILPETARVMARLEGSWRRASEPGAGH
ncbi:MAG: phosphotransferase [Acidobacteriota bacterium]|nr:phosphotransferase [Acidobacteriota bacterium]MDH3523230.1 phosphotransferase [Acidobacteriota bacterium]